MFRSYIAALISGLVLLTGGSTLGEPQLPPKFDKTDRYVACVIGSVFVLMRTQPDSNKAADWAYKECEPIAPKLDGDDVEGVGDFIAMTIDSVTQKVEQTPDDIAARKDIVQLECDFPDGGNFVALALFKKLRMIRALYADGGIIDWKDVDFNKQMIVAKERRASDKAKDDEAVNMMLSGTHYEDILYFSDFTNWNRGHCKISLKQDADLIDPKKDGAYWTNR